MAPSLVVGVVLFDAPKEIEVGIAPAGGEVVDAAVTLAGGEDEEQLVTTAEANIKIVSGSHRR